MRVVFRADASSQIGTGHLTRCITLSEALKASGAEVRFVCRFIPLSLEKIILKAGCSLTRLSDQEEKFVLSQEGCLTHAEWLGATWQQDADDTIDVLVKDECDWLIVDHYGIDSRWHGSLRPYTDRIMVIDDLADRKLDCDLLLDQNYYLNPMSRYSGLTPNVCTQLLGPEYAMLRDEFLVEQVASSDSQNDLKRIMIFMGGGDPTNETRKVILALDRLDLSEIQVDVVVGASNPYADEIRAMCLKRPCLKFHISIDYMAALIRQSCLVIGTGGVGALERSYLGIASLVMLTAKNQEETTVDMDKVGALRCMGWSGDIDVHDIYKEVCDLLYNEEALNNMMEKAKGLFGNNSYKGAKGVVERMKIHHE